MGILTKWKKSIYKRLIKYKLVPSRVIVMIDGGVCSQMHQYLLGYLYLKKGYNVVFDLSFFDAYGMDKDRKFVRNFDLLKAFPYLELKAASDTAADVYRRNYFYGGNNNTSRVDDFSFLDDCPPLYLGGYYHFPASVWLPAFKELYKVDLRILDEENLQICSEIQQRKSSVAVHVRRGDLKVEQYDYGMPPSMDYFKRGVSFFMEIASDAFFYFFSDEPDWVESELLPYLGLNGINSKVVDLNGSDRGYMDLFLMSQCKYQIASKGTLGKYAAILCDDAEKVVVLCDDPLEYRWRELLNHTEFL